MYTGNNPFSEPMAAWCRYMSFIPAKLKQPSISHQATQTASDDTAIIVKDNGFFFTKPVVIDSGNIFYIRDIISVSSVHADVLPPTTPGHNQAPMLTAKQEKIS